MDLNLLSTMRRIYLLALFLGPIWVWATSTGGVTPRNVLVDGQIGSLVPAGSNNGSGEWEQDEVFAGFSGIVNWYMTWDDTNLYIGRSGGDNSEGTVLYLQAGYAGSTSTTNAYDYDGLRPDMTPMGGINFAAYLKDTTDQFRTWNGAWSAPGTTLTPAFATVGGRHEMEVAIPWNAITNGNGKPDNVRAVFYQVVPAATAGCVGGGAFVFGESPWGTGNTPDGPFLGVNDGTPTSTRQPGGCDAGDSTATRWWGCYPVTANVGANDWGFQQPVAGNDTTICDAATAFILQGNLPLGNGVGTWQSIGTPTGAAPVTIASPNSPQTLVSNLTTLGDYTFSYEINDGGCPSLPDTIVITRVIQPGPPNAGPDQDLICNLDNATLAGSIPSLGVGTWTLVSGGGTVTSPSDPNSSVTSLAYGDNVFQWVVSNGACQSDSDQISITRYQPVTSLAGSDQELCQVSMASMDGIMPSFFGGNPIGTWSLVNGPTIVVFTDVNAFNTSVTNMTSGTYQLSWSISNGTCPTSIDTVSVQISPQPLADAGPDEVLCYMTDMYQLNAMDPNQVSPTAQLNWQQTFGPSQANIQDNTLYNTQVTGLEPGMYKFLLTVGDGACPVESDVITLELYELQNQGATVTNASFGLADGAVTLEEPLNGVAPFAYSLDGVNFFNNNTFADLPPGNYTGSIRDDEGCETSFTFEIEELEPPGVKPLSIVVPTGFSPNADNVNDTWLLENIEQYLEASVEVYSEWGGLVFRSVGYETPWNGTFNGKDLPAATYYFILNPNREGEDVQKGPITIFR